MPLQTIKQDIVDLFNTFNMGRTCTDITKYIIKKRNLKGNVAKNKSGSISSILAKMVKDGELEYADYKTKRGGHVYVKPTNNT